MDPDAETDQAKDAGQTQNSEVNATLLGKEKEGHCQLSLADYQAKAAVAGLALEVVESSDQMAQSHSENLLRHSVYHSGKDDQTLASRLSVLNQDPAGLLLHGY